MFFFSVEINYGLKSSPVHYSTLAVKVEIDIGNYVVIGD